MPQLLDDILNACSDYSSIQYLHQHDAEFSIRYLLVVKLYSRVSHTLMQKVFVHGDQVPLVIRMEVLVWIILTEDMNMTTRLSTKNLVDNNPYGPISVATSSTGCQPL